MRQALVVGGSARAGFAIEQRLIGQGFESVDMVSDLANAARLADEDHFDLVVVLGGSCQPTCDELLAAAAKFDVPMLVARRDPLKSIDCLVRGAPFGTKEKIVEPRRLAA